MSVVVSQSQLSLAGKLKAYLELMKLRLSSLVVFSSAMTYLLASQEKADLNRLMWFLIGGLMATGASNIINQIAERDLDKLMKRTMGRPLPTGRVSVTEAATVCLVLGILGLAILVLFVNTSTALLTFLSMMLYGFLYTPLKQIHPIAVLVGAIPGAMPPLIGWVAAADQITMPAIVLFGIQFIWQFPHFWAIAWVLDDDYKRAGFKLLPSGGGRDVKTAFTIMIYTLFLIPLGLLPTYFGLTGTISAIIATVCGLLFLTQTFYLMKECTQKAAKAIMFGSFLYLPIVQIAFVLDKV